MKRNAILEVNFMYCCWRLTYKYV